MLKKDDLIAVLSAGCKPKSSWRMGLEHEQFPYDLKSGAALPYDGAQTGTAGLKQILDYLHEHRGWHGQKFEGENVIALYKQGAGKFTQSVTLEPAGQIELSGAPHQTIADMAAEHQSYLEDLAAAGKALGAGFLSQGFPAQWRREDIHWMPKARYKIMREYMPKRGNLGLDMMTRTSGCQINLDFESEADMVRKYRITVALQPFMIGLYANSNIVEGKDSGYASFRAHIWSDTDPDRTGILPFIFEENMSFERYVDYVLDVPMYFIERDGNLIDMSGKSFRDFMNGVLPENKKYHTTIKDWEDHLTTVFPEVRLKQFLELRGTDSVEPPKLYALASFWVGILYDEAALAEAENYIKNWSIDDHETFRANAVKLGMNAPVPQHGGKTIRDLAPEVIDIAARGLKAQPEQQSGIVYLDALYPNT